MNKKLIISLSTIAAIAIIAIGATTAYYSNTERSTGNTFSAGEIDLKIDNECHYNGNVCKANDAGAYIWTGTSPYPVPGTPCSCTWALTDLDGRAIFNFADVKPGDEGEDTISLHVDSNPAWVCAEVSNIAQTENGCNTPEEKVDGTCNDPGIGEGELWKNLYFSIWMDNGAGDGTACNNIKDGEEAYLVENAPATDIKYPIVDSQTGGKPIQDACIGVAWSVPDDVGNEIQGDSVTGDITFSAYQARNNERFVCGPPITGTLTVIKNVVGGTAVAGDFTINVTGTNPNPASFPGSESGTPVSIEEGSYEVSESSVSGYTAAYSADCKGTILAGEAKTCTITNSTDKGTITVNKIVENNGVGTKTVDDFQMTIDGNNVAKATPIEVGVGPHAVSEADNYGYVKTYSGDCDSSGNITAIKDQNVTCTVTNTFPYFTVTVTKVVNNINGGNNVVADFNLFVGSTQVTSGVSKKVAVGTYLINETGVGGYDGEFTGDCDSNTQLLTGANGETKTCTITNTDLKPNITLIKIVSGGTAQPNDFIMRVDGVPVPNGGSKLVTSNAGHTIDEDAKAGYVGTISGNAKCPAALGGSATLNEGEAITCTITNTFQQQN